MHTYVCQTVYCATTNILLECLVARAEATDESLPSLYILIPKDVMYKYVHMYIYTYARLLHINIICIYAFSSGKSV